MEIVNVFDDDGASRRYAAGRPDVHDKIVATAREMLGSTTVVPRALDVACGTGLSSRALARVAEHVVGCDVSLPMLRRAVEHHPGQYLAAVAERLPFRSSVFDLITVSSAFHWFRRDGFAAEAARVLTPDGALVIYDTMFRADLENRPDFREWVIETYLARFPNPPRHPRLAPDEALAGFGPVSARSYQFRVEMTAAALADYLLSQSNLNVVIADGTASERRLRSWLAAELAPFFVTAERGSFLFGGTIHCLRCGRAP